MAGSDGKISPVTTEDRLGKLLGELDTKTGSGSIPTSTTSEGLPSSLDKVRDIFFWVAPHH